MDLHKDTLGMLQLGLTKSLAAAALVAALSTATLAQEPKAAPKAGEGAAPKAAPKAEPAEVVVKAEAPAAAKKVYQVLPVAAVPAQRLAEVKQTVHKVLQGSLPLDENQKAFDGYFTAYLFPLMTQEDLVPQLAKAREQVFKDFLRQQGSPDAHDRLIAVTLDFMKKVADGNFHPSARVNAMLIIGELNTTEANSAQRITQQPMLEALNVMLDEVTSPNQIDAVRVAALVGIMRHAEVDRTQPAGARRMPATASGAVVTRLTPLITAKEPPANRSEGGHNWMRRRAIEIIGSIGQVDKNEEIPLTLEALLVDEAAPYSLRVTAAAALGRISGASKKLDPGEVARKMGVLAADIISQDVDVLAEQNQKAKDKARAALVAAGVSGGSPEFVDPVTDPEIRRRLKQWLSDVNIGLVGAGKEGILPLVTKEPAKANAKKIADGVAGMLALVEKPTLTRGDFVDSAEPLLTSIREASRGAEEKKPPAATPAKPATPGDEFGEGDLK